jgi:hypothetical protein
MTRLFEEHGMPNLVGFYRVGYTMGGVEGLEKKIKKISSGDTVAAAGLTGPTRGV